MGHFIVVRPKDDAVSQQASDWCDQLVSRFTPKSHILAQDVDDTTPADRVNIQSALGTTASLVCYFGHGDENSWLTHSAPTIDAANVAAAGGKAVVSIACKTACNLGPTAITGGAVAWLGATINVPVISPHRTIDPFGDAIVDGLSCLATGGSMQDARDAISANCDALVTSFDTGPMSTHPARSLGYYAAMALRDHLVVHGSPKFVPL